MYTVFTSRLPDGPGLGLLLLRWDVDDQTNVGCTLFKIPGCLIIFFQGVLLLRWDVDDQTNVGCTLFKIPGCLMILAWVFFSSIGMLMTKYYTTMWPNKRMFDHRYWFMVGTLALDLLNTFHAMEQVPRFLRLCSHHPWNEPLVP